MTDTAVTTSQNNLPSDLNQLTVEIKFYINQWGQNTIEIGKRLIAAKKIVGHGNFGKWLDDNFNLSHNVANKFMKCAERFSNCSTSNNFNQSQMFEMLVLSPEETEKFIAAKTAEGKPFEDTTVKELREEIKDWKAKLEQKNSEVEKLFSEKSALETEKNQLEKDNAELTKQRDDVMEHSAEVQNENEELKMQLENQKPTEKIVEPEDYEPLKKERDDLQNQIAELEKKLADKAIEIEVPADYDENKKQLAELQAKLDEVSELAVIVQTFESISQQIDSIHFAGNIGKALEYYEKNLPKGYQKFLANVTDFFNLVKE